VAEQEGRRAERQEGSGEIKGHMGGMCARAVLWRRKAGFMMCESSTRSSQGRKQEWEEALLAGVMSCCAQV
jgi:hypothetical protein